MRRFQGKHAQAVSPAESIVKKTGIKTVGVLYIGENIFAIEKGHMEQGEELLHSRFGNHEEGRQR